MKPLLNSTNDKIITGDNGEYLSHITLGRKDLKQKLILDTIYFILKFEMVGVILPLKCSYPYTKIITFQ